VDIIVGIIDNIHELVTTYPPEKTKSRFGNVGFRSFCDALSEVHNGYQP
jgi:hypothetical protein